VVGGSAFDWTDAGVGFAAAAGLALLGAGSVVAVRSRRMSTARR
jgi:LPXTG-motif cell wall-anchored protein